MDTSIRSEYRVQYKAEDAEWATGLERAPPVCVQLEVWLEGIPSKPVTHSASLASYVFHVFTRTGVRKRTAEGAYWNGPINNSRWMNGWNSVPVEMLRHHPRSHLNCILGPGNNNKMTHKEINRYMINARTNSRETAFSSVVPMGLTHD